MCVVSMVMDHYRDRWEPLVPQTHPWTNPNITVWPQVQITAPPAISEEEIAEFKKLLERAREYDKRHGEPECELDEKRQALKKIANALGVEISFP